MGYYTYYSLNVYPEKKKDRPGFDSEKIIKYVRQYYPDWRDVIDWDGSGLDSTKNYDWEEQFRKISKKKPGIIFELSGDGESTDDNWIAYFLDGKCQVCRGEIKYPPYDPAKLE